MILRETTVLDAIEGAFGSFSDAVQPAWGYITYGDAEPSAGNYSTQELLEIMLEDEGE